MKINPINNNQTNFGAIKFRNQKSQKRFMSELKKLPIEEFEKALDYQINDILSNIDNVDTDYLFVTHSEGDEEANYVLEHLPEEVKSRFKNIYVTKAGCVISSHCGQGTLGILYIKKEPLVDDK